MTDILFIKTSSLGDVVHHLPVITDLRRHLPEAHIGWVVEEAFAPLVRLHPGVNEVIPVAWRRWRKALGRFSVWCEIGAAIQHLRARRYDAIIDTQGLVRTAAMAKLSRGVRHGYDRRSVREPLASLGYDIRHSVPRSAHAVARNRALAGLALGYQPEGGPDYGLTLSALRGEGPLGGADAPAPARPYAVLLHATARVEKQWPVESWIALGQGLMARGMGIVLPWGDAAERARSLRIAAAVPGAIVPDERRPLDEVAGLIGGAAVVIGVDTGLLHVAAALGVPLVAIFVASTPELTRPVGRGPMGILGHKGGHVSLPEVEAALGKMLSD